MTAKTKRYGAFALAAIVMIYVLLAFFFFSPKSDALAAGAELSVHFVDVGQGDCTLIELPDGKTIVIDGAENGKTHETEIQTFIDNNLAGLQYFDYAILTHPDSDHCGSLDYILEKYPARVCYRPNVEATGTDKNPYDDPGKNSLGDGAEKKNTAAYAGAIKAMYATTEDFTSEVRVTNPDDESQTITGGEGDDSYSLTFYSPLSVSYTDWNNYSPIMILSYRGFKFAISGDAEKENEAEFVKKVNDAKTDGVTDKYDDFTDEFSVNVIKAGHHGSRTSTSKDYIDAVTTEEGAKSVYYIFSCNAVGNKYGHPHAETLDRLKSMQVPADRILRTDLIGDITIKVSAESGGAYGISATAAKTSTVDPFTPGSAGDGQETSGDPTTEPTVEPTPTEPTTEDSGFKEFFEKNKVWIIIVIVIIVLLIIILFYLYKRNNKRGKSGKGKGGGKGKR